MNSNHVGRNDLCPCGSGKKFKKCCLDRQSAALAAASARSASHQVGRSTAATSVRANFVGDWEENLRLGRAGSQERPHPSSVDVLPVEVGLDYTYPEPYGTAEVTYTLPGGRLVCLADGRRVFADQLVPGAAIQLEKDGAVATITAVHLDYEPPALPVRMSNGLWCSRVVGTIKHIANALLDVRWSGTTVTGTCDHPFYSATRETWVRAEELRVGEFLRTDDNRIVPVEEISKPRFGSFEVYNIEVEHFHTYYVGNGANRVLVHNGGCINKPKEVAGITGFTRHGLNQAVERGVKTEAIRDALKYPLKIGPRKIGPDGLPSIRYYGKYAEVVINPDTLKIVSVNPMGSQRLARILRQLDFLPFLES